MEREGKKSAAQPLPSPDSIRPCVRLVSAYLRDFLKIVVQNHVYYRVNEYEPPRSLKLKRLGNAKPSAPSILA
jgi:hypothetical protein